MAGPDFDGTRETSTHIAPVGATTNITAVPATFADLAAVRTYLAGAGVFTNIEARLDALEAKMDALIAALIASDQMMES